MLNSKILFNFYKYKRKLIHLKYSYTNYSSSSNLKVLFFGTDNFSLPSLKVLHNESKINSKLYSLGVVTSFKSPSNPIKIYASENNDIELHRWPVTPEICNKYTLGIVVSFGHLIPEKLISSFPFGMINLHASMLPKWRGAAPIIHSMKNGDTKTGVTIMKIEPKKFDIGDILYQKEVNIPPDILMPDLHHILSIEGAKLLHKTILECPECFKEFKKQNDKLVSYAPKIQPHFTEVHWSKMSAKQVYDLYRSLYTFKNISTKFQNFIVKINELRYINDKDKNIQENHLPGFIEYSKNDKTLKVFCNDGNFVEILQMKIGGKKVISAQDFNNGFLKKCSKEERYFK